MKVTYNWLKNFVDFKISPQELAQKLTMAGLEVVALEKIGGDFVLEIEITSNRPDWLSVLGIAREVSAITGEKLKLGAGYLMFGAKDRTKKLIYSTKSLKTKTLISIADKKDCSLYTARIIKNVKVVRLRNG